LKEKNKLKGVITHSSGNHAQAVALVSSILNIKSVIVMPENAPKVKVDATIEYGAKIVRCANNIEAREKTCQNIIKKHGYNLIHPYDDDQIISGAGTVAFELIREIGNLDYIFCPVGGGGLLSGTSIAAKGLCPNIIIIAVEPKLADDAYRSFKDGKLYQSKYPSTIADGLRTSLSQRTFRIIQKHVDEIITVSEKEIIDAMKFMWIYMKIIIEPSGAVPIAGLIKMKNYVKERKVGVIVSGGNVDLDGFFKEYYEKLL
jgi:threonine dehydratase